MITVGKVSMKKYFQENKVMPLLHGAFQMFILKLILCDFLFASNDTTYFLSCDR